MWPQRTTKQKEESLDKVTRPAIVGIYVSRDWLDIYRLPGRQGLWLPNTSKGHARLVELRKRLPAQIKANEKLGTADRVADMDGDLWELLDRQAAQLETRIEKMKSSDDELATTTCFLRSVPGIGPVASKMPIAEMPELWARYRNTGRSPHRARAHCA